MDKNVEFMYMHKDVPCTQVKVSGTVVSFTNFTADIIRSAFGVRTSVTRDYVEHFLESRCFPRDRDNKKELLKALNIDYYDALEICKVTHGVMFDDFHWIKFNGETIKWKDIRVR